jgi:hypothetical protein
MPEIDIQMRRRALLFGLRYLLPAAVCAAGVLYASLTTVGVSGPVALSTMFGAGGSIYLMNKLMRVGIDGDSERDDEEAARVFLDRYGMWPDEVPAGWRPPDGEPDAQTALARILERQPTAVHASWSPSRASVSTRERAAGGHRRGSGAPARGHHPAADRRRPRRRRPGP